MDVRLGVRTLQAELHEGLFCSPLLHRVTARSPQPSPGQGQEQGWQSPRFHCSQRDLAVLSLLPSAGSGSLGKSLSVTLFPAPDSAESLKSPSLLSRDTLQLIPRRVEVKLESTSVVLSMNSQKR